MDIINFNIWCTVVCEMFIYRAMDLVDTCGLH